MILWPVYYWPIAGGLPNGSLPGGIWCRKLPENALFAASFLNSLAEKELVGIVIIHGIW